MYLTKLFTSFVAAIFLVAIINWFIDPYGMFWSPTVTDLNEKKVKANSRVRLTKLYRPSVVSPEILIVGNSRAGMGLNPQQKLFENKVVYNQALPGSTVTMQVNYALNVINKSPKLEKIIMSLDIADFLDKKSTSPQMRKINPASLYTSDNAQNLLSLLFSVDTLSDSIKTIAQQNHQTSSLTANGFYDAESFLPIIKNEGIITLYHQKYKQIEQKLSHDLYLEEREGKSTQLAALQVLLNNAYKNNIDLVFFISPYHYSYLHTINDTGYWNSYLNWKVMISQFIESQEHDIQLWDFSGFNKFTTETVPLQHIGDEMQWYWEPSHYRESLGRKIVQTLLSKSSKDNSFGYILNSVTINNKLEVDNKGLKTTQSKWNKLKSAIK